MQQSMLAQQKHLVKTDPRIKLFSRLFIFYCVICAIVNPFNFKRHKDRQPLLLEVASENDLVRWIWLRPTSPRSGFVIPVLPSYEQQMRNILSVIAAKTGLPLYDLRKKR